MSGAFCGADDNPRANRCLKDRAFDDIDHALGRPVFPLRETSRNYFATESGGAQDIEFARSPHWAFGRRIGVVAYYWVTDAGRAALAEHLAEVGHEWRAFAVSYGGHARIVPARSAAQARYAYFLDVSDVLPDLTFGNFARGALVRRVR